MIKLPKYFYTETTSIGKQNKDCLASQKLMQKYTIHYQNEIKETLYTAAERFANCTPTKKQMAENVIDYLAYFDGKSGSYDNFANVLVPLSNMVECMNKNDYNQMHELIKASILNDKKYGTSCTTAIIQFLLWFMPKDIQKRNKSKLIKHLDKMCNGLVNADDLYESYALCIDYKNVLDSLSEASEEVFKYAKEEEENYNNYLDHVFKE